MIDPAVGITGPAVSVLVPTYLRNNYLRVAIRSALAQTFTDFVLLVGDNANDATTAALVAELGDPRIEYIGRAENLGLQGNFLDLVARASTPFVACLHDDDMWEPTFLERLVPAMLADPTVDIAFADYTVIDVAGCPMIDETADERRRSHRDQLVAGTLRPDLDQAIRLACVWNAPQPAYCAVLRRSFVLGIDYPPETDGLYDIWTSYHAALRGSAFVYVAESLTCWRWHPTQSTVVEGFAPTEDWIFEQVIRDHPDLPAIDELKVKWATVRFARALKLTRSGDRTRAQHEFACAAPHLPGARRVVAALGARGPAWALARAAVSVHDRLGRR